MASSQERGSSSSRRDEWLEGDEDTADARCLSSSLRVAGELGGKPNGQVSAHQVKKDFKARKTAPPHAPEKFKNVKGKTNPWKAQNSGVLPLGGVRQGRSWRQGALGISWQGGVVLLPDRGGAAELKAFLATHDWDP